MFIPGKTGVHSLIFPFCATARCIYSKYGSTALMLIVSAPYLSAHVEEVIALALIKAEADTSLRNRYGRTALEEWRQYQTNASLRHRVDLAVELCNRQCTKRALAFFACYFEIEFGLGCCQDANLVSAATAATTTTVTSAVTSAVTPQTTYSAVCGSEVSASLASPRIARFPNTSFEATRESANLVSRALSHAHGGMNLICMAGYL